MQVPAAGMVYALASSGADAVSTDAVLYGCKKYPMLSTFDHIAVNISCCAAYAGILYIPHQAGHAGKPGLCLPACDTAIYRTPRAICIRGSKQRKKYGIYYNRDESLSGAFWYRY